MLNPLMIITSAAMMTGCAGTQPSADQDIGPDTRIRCHDTLYEGFSDLTETAIPDGDPRGTRIGPVHIVDDGQEIGVLLVGLDISHDYVGDLEIQLLYDEDGDGSPESRSELELFRVRPDPCTGDELHAYPVVLDGCYFFRGYIGEPSTDEASPLGSFANLHRGGDFYLHVTDNSPDNAGAVRGWTVFVASVGGVG